METKPESEEIIVETVLIPLASEENLSFSLANFETFKQERNATLSEKELEAISGGAEPMKGAILGLCFGYGLASGESDEIPGSVCNVTEYAVCIGIGF